MSLESFPSVAEKPAFDSKGLDKAIAGLDYRQTIETVLSALGIDKSRVEDLTDEEVAMLEQRIELDGQVSADEDFGSSLLRPVLRNWASSLQNALRNDRPAK